MGSGVSVSKAFSFGNTSAIQGNINSLYPKLTWELVMLWWRLTKIPSCLRSLSRALELCLSSGTSKTTITTLELVDWRLLHKWLKVLTPLPWRLQREKRPSSAQVMFTSSIKLRRKASTSHTPAELDLAALALENWSREPSITPTNPSWMRTKSPTDSFSPVSLIQLLIASSRLTKKMICSEDIPLENSI